MTSIKKLIGTDTAAFCIFDLAALHHRLTDTCDWWSLEELELEEINKGSCIVFGTGVDGGFEFHVLEGETVSSPSIEAVIRVPSGQIYIGPGEHITGEDFAPEEGSGDYNGIFLTKEKGHYLVSIRNDKADVFVSFTKSDRDAVNDFKDPLRIELY